DVYKRQGYEVTKLKRTRIMHLELGSLKPGQWRNLTSRELTIMQNAVRSSTKTASKVELRK
ncbi:23S rRNA pseudouridine synthase F, partial [Alteromonas sp. MCA-1]|nr:23S rRNA pseudouridine synthase F [Alteromonas sp. MCA-1]